MPVLHPRQHPYRRNGFWNTNRFWNTEAYTPKARKELDEWADKINNEKVDFIVK